MGGIPLPGIPSRTIRISSASGFAIVAGSLAIAAPFALPEPSAAWHPAHVAAYCRAPSNPAPPACACADTAKIDISQPNPAAPTQRKQLIAPT
jgi:hypothetical protein